MKLTKNYISKLLEVFKTTETVELVGPSEEVNPQAAGKIQVNWE